MPRISVISAAYNMERVFSFRASVESILKQSFFDIEIIICDDGSTDNTYGVLCEYAERDPRILVIRNEGRQGLAASLNKCIRYASSELFARHDLDDISHPDRLMKQYIYLRTHESISLLGTAAVLFDRNGGYGVRSFPHTVKAEDFLFNSPYVHGSVIIRREAFLAVGGYKVARVTRRTEDYDLFMRLALVCRGANLSEPLYYYLEDSATLARRKYRYRIDEVAVRAAGFRALGLMPRALPYVIKPLAVGLLPRGILSRLKLWRERSRHESRV